MAKPIVPAVLVIASILTTQETFALWTKHERLRHGVTALSRERAFDYSATDLRRTFSLKEGRPALIAFVGGELDQLTQLQAILPAHSLGAFKGQRAFSITVVTTAKLTNEQVQKFSQEGIEAIQVDDAGQLFRHTGVALVPTLLVIGSGNKTHAVFEGRWPSSEELSDVLSDSGPSPVLLKRGTPIGVISGPSDSSQGNATKR